MVKINGIQVGYDAYVVVGYAPRTVVMNDQTKEEYPVFENDMKAAAAVLGKPSNSPRSSKDLTTEARKYAVKPPKVLESMYMKV